MLRHPLGSRRGRPVAALLALGLLLAGARARSLEPIEDHRDEWGLTASIGAVYDTAAPLARDVLYTPGVIPSLEVGGTYAVTDTGDELTLRMRLVDGPSLGPMFLGGYRSYFGDDWFKTFFAAELFGLTAPFWSIGAHGGVGAQYDIGRAFGLFAELGFGAAVGGVIYRSFDGNLGAQVRF
ncbi:MAG: hypothetical protein ACYCWW_13485 [Deltaproteobacteria bacterium]